MKLSLFNKKKMREIRQRSEVLDIANHGVSNNTLKEYNSYFKILFHQISLQLVALVFLTPHLAQ